MLLVNICPFSWISKYQAIAAVGAAKASTPLKDIVGSAALEQASLHLFTAAAAVMMMIMFYCKICSATLQPT